MLVYVHSLLTRLDPGCHLRSSCRLRPRLPRPSKLQRRSQRGIAGPAMRSHTGLHRLSPQPPNTPVQTASFSTGSIELYLVLTVHDYIARPTPGTRRPESPARRNAGPLCPVCAAVQSANWCWCWCRILGFSCSDLRARLAILQCNMAVSQMSAVLSTRIIPITYARIQDTLAKKHTLLPSFPFASQA